MELIKIQQKTIQDNSTKVFAVNGSLAIKDTLTLGNKHSLPSFGSKAPVHKPMYKNGVHINCDNNDNKGLTDKHSTFPKKAKFVAVKNIRLNDLQKNGQKGKFINIHQASSKLVFRPVCRYCRKILTTKETLASHFKVCNKFNNYACDKCTYISWNKSDLDSHRAVHAPRECSKCSQVFENETSLAIHFRTVCREPRAEKIYTCHICAFSCKQTSELESHMKLHPVCLESAQFRRNPLPRKEAGNKGVLVVTAKSLYAKEYDDDDVDVDVDVETVSDDSSSVKDQSNSVDQNSTINSSQDQSILDSLSSTNRDHAYSKTQEIALENPNPSNKHVDMCSETAYSKTEEKALENPKSLNKRVVDMPSKTDYSKPEEKALENPRRSKRNVEKYRMKSNNSKVCTNEGSNLGSEENPIPKKIRSKNKNILRHCVKCKRDTYDFVWFYDMRPICNFCHSKLMLRCTVCDKKMIEYFDAVEHMEFECNKQDKHDRNVELVSKRKRLRQTDNSSDDRVDKISSSKNDDDRLQIVRHCENCNTNFDPGCYSEKRPRCIACQAKLQFKCVLCDKLMTEYFVAVEHTELQCYEQEQLDTEQFIENIEMDETEKEVDCKTRKKRANHRSDEIESGNVTKICRTCNIRTEFDVTSGCRTCYRKCTFQCNRCKKEFGNYQVATRHVWTQCVPEGFYFCLKCDFKSPTKLKVRRHCESQHPEFSDPLGTAEEADYIEYRGSEGDAKSQNLSRQQKLPKPNKRVNSKSKTHKFSRSCRHCEVTFRTRHRFIKHLIHCMKPGAFACMDCLFKTNSKLHLRNHMLSYHLNLPSINADSLVNSSVDYFKNSPPYKCRFCNHISQRKAALQLHEGRVHARELEVLEEINEETKKFYECNVCSHKFVDKLGDIKQHILRVHMKGYELAKLPPCARCGWDFQGCRGLKKHLAYCGKKLYMQCRVNLVKLKMKPAVSNDILAEAIKEEAIDLGEFHMKIEP